MTQFLPPNLLALFAARDPIPFLPPPAPLSHERRTTGYTGVGEYLKYFETGEPPIPPKYETREERHERKRKEKKEQVTYKLEQEIAMWNPAENDKATSDPKRTLFVGRINFDTTESKLRREFETYGKISKVVMVKDKKTSKPRGYAFVEFERESSMHAAYNKADGMKIDGKRVLVDLERAREEKTWLPRRLGGGLGGTRRGGPDMNVKISGREDADRDRFRSTDGGRRRDRRERSRSVDGSARRRDRSLDRKPDRVDRRRSRDRSDRIDRDRDTDKKDLDRDRKRSRRDDKDKSRKRSKSHDRKRHRSRSKDKDRKRDRKDKDRGDRDKPRDRDRKDRDRTIKTESDGDGPAQIKIKEEPKDDYPSFDDDYGYPANHIKQEEEDDDEPNNHNNNHSNEY